MRKGSSWRTVDITGPRTLIELGVGVARRCFDWGRGAAMISRVVTWRGHGMKALPSRTKLRVGIASSGRFHLLDLARELDALGVEVCFYSYLSRTRVQTFGLPGRCHISLFSTLFPLVALERLFPWIFPRTIERLMCWALDALTILRMRRCDVFICMSGIYVHAPRFAQWRYGARVVLHRGSRHILSQKEIMAHTSLAQQVTPFMVRRELQGYAIADRIAVPSTQVVESFAPWPEHACKLFLSPYGVSL